jgi:hypothetical protein
LVVCSSSDRHGDARPLSDCADDEHLQPCASGSPARGSFQHGGAVETRRT